jgi:hypothetical protein
MWHTRPRPWHAAGFAPREPPDDGALSRSIAEVHRHRLAQSAPLVRGVQKDIPHDLEISLPRCILHLLPRTGKVTAGYDGQSAGVGLDDLESNEVRRLQ